MIIGDEETRELAKKINWLCAIVDNNKYLPKSHRLHIWLSNRKKFECYFDFEVKLVDLILNRVKHTMKRIS